MLILPEKDQAKQQLIEARIGMTHHFNYLMEQILNANYATDKYWILGKTRVEEVNGKQVVRPFLQACMEKPGIIRESFVYEVDNRRGVKTLLWVMHPGDRLSFPTLGKSICVASKKGVNMPPVILTGESKSGV